MEMKIIILKDFNGTDLILKIWTDEDGTNYIAKEDDKGTTFLAPSASLSKLLIEILKGLD